MRGFFFARRARPPRRLLQDPRPARVQVADRADRLGVAFLQAGQRFVGGGFGSAGFSFIFRHHSPPPQRCCQATPSASWLLPVRAETPLLAENLIEFRGSTGRARVAPMRQLRCRSLLRTPSIVERPPPKYVTSTDSHLPDAKPWITCPCNAWTGRCSRVV